MMMANDDEQRELANGLILGGAVLVALLAAWFVMKVLPSACEFAPQPQQVLPEEHSVLVEREA